ncbi:MAG TPA: Fic family protein [Patescibacteria group bacterium]|nr:Fic family protein [Patescibacteria group bacterium]
MFYPTFVISNKILKNIGIIEAAREVVMGAPLLPLWEKQFREDAIVRTAHHGTHIEGNKLDIREAKDVLLGKEVIGRPRDVQEIINYRKVLELIEDEVMRKIERISEDLIKKIHRIVVAKILSEKQAGIYRASQVVVRNSDTGEVTFRPPPAVEVPFLMREFLYWLNKAPRDDVHPVIQAGVAHHELVRIHPFIDGNGRVARTLATLILFLGTYDIRKFFSLEEYYDKDAVSYYENLKKASEGNLTSWLEYFTLGVAREFERIKSKVTALSKDTQFKKKLGGKQIFLSERQVKIIEYIQSVGYLQNQTFKELFPDISEDSVLRDIKDLIENGIIKKIGKTKAARYVMT